MTGLSRFEFFDSVVSVTTHIYLYICNYLYIFGFRRFDSEHPGLLF